MEWIKCSERMPKIEDQIILYYPIKNMCWSWCGGEVDGDDYGMFVRRGDFEVDGQEITTDCYWFPLPEPPDTENKNQQGAE